MYIFIIELLKVCEYFWPKTVKYEYPKSKHPKSCPFLRSVVNFRRESEANFERLNLVMQTGGGDLIMSNARRGKILKEIPLSFDAKANYPLW